MGARSAPREKMGFHVGVAKKMPTKWTRPGKYWRYFRKFHNLPRVGARCLGIPAFAPRSEPPRARPPGAQMIRMASDGSSLVSRRLSRDTLKFIISVRLAETREHREAWRASRTEQNIT
eukprot:gene13022-biopygen7982